MTLDPNRTIMRVVIYTISLMLISQGKKSRGKEDPIMKKYVAPEMKALAFVAEESVAAPLDGSKLFNDGELEW